MVTEVAFQEKKEKNRYGYLKKRCPLGEKVSKTQSYPIIARWTLLHCTDCFVLSPVGAMQNNRECVGSRTSFPMESAHV